jgi:cytochrome c2
MDSFEWNKIAGAVLFALLVSVGLGIFSGIIFSTEKPESPGYVVAVASTESAPAAPAAKPIAVLLQTADAKKGEAAAKICTTCHDLTKGGPNKVGPNLYGVLDRPIASHPGFDYSDAMKQHAKDAGTWTYENLNTFLTDPRQAVSGTKMTFAGLKNDSDRANVIAYLRTLSDSPPPLPEPPAQAASAAPAGGTEAASAGAAATAAPATGAPAPAAPAAESSQAGQAPAGSSTAASQPTTQPAGEQTAQAAAPASQPAAAPAAAAGDATKGEAYAKRCTVCHDLSNAAQNKVGPHLWGVFGRHIASVSDYNYSDAMKKFSDNSTKVWDAPTLDTYLTNPPKVVPGTKMTFPGIPSEDDRQNVIAYLQTLHD